MVRHYEKRPLKSAEDKRLAKALKQRRYRARKNGFPDDGQDPAVGTDSACTQWYTASLPPNFESTSQVLDTTVVRCHSAPAQAEPLPSDGGDVGREDHERTVSRNDTIETDLSDPAGAVQAHDEILQSGLSTDTIQTVLSAPLHAHETQDKLCASGEISVNLLDAENRQQDDINGVASEAPSEDDNGGEDQGIVDDDGHVLVIHGQAIGSTNEHGSVLWLASELANIRLSSNVSDMALEKVFKLFVNNARDIQRLKNNGEITDSYLNSVKPKSLEHIPPVWCAVKVRHLGPDLPNVRARCTQEPQLPITTERDLRRIPNKYIRPTHADNVQIVEQESYVKFIDLKKHFESTHSHLTRAEMLQAYANTVIGIDGIKESSKGARKLIVITIMLRGCILPYRILNPTKADSDCVHDAESQLRLLVEEVKADCDMKIKHVLADKVERHVLKCLPGVTGKYSCEYCICPGKGTKLGWPYLWSTKFRKRDLASYRHTATRVREKDKSDINRRETKGVLGYSPLLDLHDFDLLEDCPIDEFHMVREGLTKLMLKRILLQSQTPEAKEVFRRVNHTYIRMRVFTECPRRTRSLKHFNDFKGNELLTVTMTLMPFIFTWGIRQRNGIWSFKRKALLVYTFIVRAYFHDDDVLDQVQARADMQELHRMFYRWFQLGFAKPYSKAVPPNVHCFSHLLDSRTATGPLWETTTEPFEAMYSVVRRCFRPGTPNCPKQIMENFYVRDKLKHRCRFDARLTIKPDSGSAKFNDSIIKANGRFYEVQEEVTENVFICRKIKTEPFSTDNLALPLPWDLVGVHKFQSVDKDDTEIIPMAQVQAKVMRCKDIMCEWLPPWIGGSKLDY